MEDEKLLTVNRVKNYVPSIFRDKDANRLPPKNQDLARVMLEPKWGHM